jgi:hypothetical protein
METIIRYLENAFYAILMFGLLYFGFFMQGKAQGGDYSLYGESLGYGLLVYPGIVLVMSIYGTIKSKNWFVMPIITLVVLPYFFNIATNDSFNSFLIAYLVISLIGSAVTRIIHNRIQ